MRCLSTGFEVALRWLCTPESMPSICLLYGFGVALGGLPPFLVQGSRFEVRGSRFEVRRSASGRNLKRRKATLRPSNLSLAGAAASPSVGRDWSGATGTAKTTPKTPPRQDTSAPTLRAAKLPPDSGPDLPRIVLLRGPDALASAPPTSPAARSPCPCRLCPPGRSTGRAPGPRP